MTNVYKQLCLSSITFDLENCCIIFAQTSTSLQSSCRIFSFITTQRFFTSSTRQLLNSLLSHLPQNCLLFDVNLKSRFGIGRNSVTFDVCLLVFGFSWLRARKTKLKKFLLCLSNSCKHSSKIPGCNGVSMSRQ